jgi:hypothetical protein
MTTSYQRWDYFFGFYDDELPTCGICFYAYDDGEHTPLIEPCGHTMCQKCTHDILKSGQECVCPQCRKPLGQTSLNFELVRYISYVNKKVAKQASSSQSFYNPKGSASAGIESSDVTICSVCNEAEKCVVCTDCANVKPVCSVCFDVAHRKKAAKHQTTPWSSAHMPSICRDHQHECVLYCHPCKKVVCVLCVHTATHRGHLCSPVMDEVEATKREIYVKCCELEERTKPVQALARQVDSVYLELTGESTFESDASSSKSVGSHEDTFDATIRTIRTQFQKFHADLQLREEELIAEAHAVKLYKVTALENQMDSISSVVSKSYSVTSTAQQNLKTKGSQWILENKASLLDSIEKSVLQTQAVLAPVVASSYLAFQVNQSRVTQFCSQIGCITSSSAKELRQKGVRLNQECLAEEKYGLILSPTLSPKYHADCKLRGYKIMSLAFPARLLQVYIPMASITEDGAFLYRGGVCVATGSAFQRCDSQWYRSILPASTDIRAGDAILCRAASTFWYNDLGQGNKNRKVGGSEFSMEILSCWTDRASENSFELHMKVVVERVKRSFASI